MNWVAAMLALHGALGLLFRLSSTLATVHALGTFVFGLYLAIRARPLFQVACWSMYVAGAEVLWRMVGASLIWEYGKYTVSLVLLIRFFRGPVRSLPWTPILYSLLLVPAIIPPLLNFFTPRGLEDTRKLLSFNLSGPLSVLACSLFFSRVHLTERRTRRLAAWMVLPIAGIAAAVLSGLTSSSTSSSAATRTSWPAAASGRTRSRVSWDWAGSSRCCWRWILESRPACGWFS